MAPEDGQARGSSSSVGGSAVSATVRTPLTVGDRSGHISPSYSKAVDSAFFSNLCEGIVYNYYSYNNTFCTYT